MQETSKEKGRAPILGEQREEMPSKTEAACSRTADSIVSLNRY